MEWELDVEVFDVGDEFVGSRDELRSFILAVRAAGGSVITVSHDTARITELPKKAQGPTITKEVDTDGDHLRTPSPWSGNSSGSLRSSHSSNSSYSR